MVREPAVSGSFYNGVRDRLIAQIEDCFTGRLGPGELPAADDKRPGNVLGLIAPHAGFMFSGYAAAHAYGALAESGAPDAAVILGPNHHGAGAAVAVGMQTGWDTPLGTVEVDSAAAEAIIAGSRFARADNLAHSREHSIEVQLPFIQYCCGAATKIVPIALTHMSEQDAITAAADLGAAIASAMEGRRAVVIASTDFTHYESQAAANLKDEMALSRILELDARGLVETVYRGSISMCGVIGTAVMLEACTGLGAKSARRLAYYTSGEVTGDLAEVVGYAAVSVEGPGVVI